MTPKQRREYSELHLRTMKRLEARFFPSIREALQTQVDDAITALKNDPLSEAIQKIDRVLFNERLANPLEALYRFFGIYAGRKTLREINRSVKINEPEKKAGFGINEELLQAILTYLRQNIIINAVLPITKSLKELILAKISEGEREGWGVDRIAREIEQADYPRWMARRVVRTESLFATRIGKDQAKITSRWELETEWIAANDHRTRHSHRDVDGKKVDEGKKFRVPIYKGRAIIGYDMMVGPGDRTASAGNVINCRCSDVTVAKRDARGRLIAKKVGNSRISVILPNERFNPSQIITI